MSDRMQNDFKAFSRALVEAGFRGDVETDSALRASMSTDNSVYQIFPDLVIAPHSSGDVTILLNVVEQTGFERIALTARGGGTGTNGQSLNHGVIVDMRRHMCRLLHVNVEEQWADVEPGIVLDDLNEKLRPQGLFFAPETSTSSRCTIGGMVSTDASGKGSRVYGKTSDNVLGIEVARAEGVLSSLAEVPQWATPMLAKAEKSARAGRPAFIANTPKLNRRFTGYDLERACPEDAPFEWWRLFLGAEGTLGPITKIRVKLRRIESGKRLVVAAFETFRDALAAAAPLLLYEPTAIEVMDDWVQKLALDAGILKRLPGHLLPVGESCISYVFIEFNGDDAAHLDERVFACRARLAGLPGAQAIHVAQNDAEIQELWAIRSAGVGLLGKVNGSVRPVAFVEDCVVPPEKLPAFLDEFLETLRKHSLDFGIYGHVDVGCLHVRPALNIDSDEDRAKLSAISDEIYALTRKYDGIFWGEHGKGVRGAYLPDWLGPEAYSALKGIKAAFDPKGQFNPGKLVGDNGTLLGIATTNFRRFNAEPNDPLEAAFRCNGNAQCLSYSAKTPMCPSFKATVDTRHSPKGRADALRAWNSKRGPGGSTINEQELLQALDTCLGCKACATACPIQVDIPTMRSWFYSDYYSRNRRPLVDRLTLLGERFSPWLVTAAPFLRFLWPGVRLFAEKLLDLTDLPQGIARALPRSRLSVVQVSEQPLPDNTVLLIQDWFTALFDESVQRDAIAGFTALGYAPVIVEMTPSGKSAHNLGDLTAFRRMATVLANELERLANSKFPIIGLDPAFVMILRQEYRRDGFSIPDVLLPQEFLTREVRRGRVMPRTSRNADVTLLSHCTEVSGNPDSPELWREVFAAVGVTSSSPSTGCCGMAGLFGHQKRHQQISRDLFNMSWAKHISTSLPVQVAATGFSCRCQVKRFGSATIRHPLSVIAENLA